jgi:hypothetical protein
VRLATFIGAPETAGDRDAAEIRRVRVRLAREKTAWTEIEEPVVRGRWPEPADSVGGDLTD